MINNRIKIAKPWITEHEIKYVEDAIRNGWGDHCFDYNVKLEKEFSELQGVNHAVATSSCTGATHMALVALGNGNGDEVLLPETTWASCASSVIYSGAKPVFVYIKKDTWCIDPASIEAAITDKTKAIMLVHSFGYPAKMDDIMNIVNKYNLFLIEDGCDCDNNYMDYNDDSSINILDIILLVNIILGE